ncbi:GDSL family lipase [Acidovorax sp. SUPP1855]|uniref:SGNH/GDSL hydrolase family protein n=1 Tax=Acidovorax sp. SUPP1855 TaxID=431774 RepID=UPI0023DE5D42|nr:SGNH/GDSL hydrolase family protein [Acidovorax sp. SUPP1855]GKS85117.1 GDSL family lipase [Acidovorax sp. SUPP1855]
MHSLRAFPTRSLVTLALACAGFAAQATPADSTAPSAAATSPSAYARWQSSMDAFAAADKERLPQAGGVLFVGSSTIRFWTDVAEDFRQLPVVINRGFGGSTMADCNHFVKNLVLQYRPRHVMVYAGDNDLAEGRTPEQILESFRSFVQTVRTELPDTRISYISIKPSPSRVALMPQMQQANALLAQYVRTVPNSDYIDVFSAMLDASGQPRAELFGPDRLHMNDAGYDLWRTVIGAFVAPAPAMRAGGASPTATAAMPAATVATGNPAMVRVSTGR